VNQTLFRPLILPLLLMILPLAATAQRAHLVADLQVGPVSQSSSPFGFVAFAGEVYFTARNEAVGMELWATDGTAQGTRLVADFCPGSCDSWAVVVGRTEDHLFLRVDDGASGDELWSLGAGGTPVRLGDLCPGACDGVLFATTVLGGRLFFQGTDGVSGLELWASDGTVAGTHQVRDICPGPCDAAPSRLTPWGDQLYFAAEDGVAGRELWASDGTAAGTRLVADLCPGCDADPRALTVFEDRLYFGADDGEVGREPWVTDGTAAGTARLADLRQGFHNTEGMVLPNSSDPQAFFAALDTLYVKGDCSNGGLCAWKESGNAWVPATELFPAGTNHGIFEALEHQGELFFTTGRDFGTDGDRLWATDGTPAGTRLVFSALLALRELTPTPDGILFTASAEVFGEISNTLWFSDGASEGTSEGAVPLGLRTSGGSIDFPRGLVSTPQGVFFQARQGSFRAEPWVTDGTEEGTGQLLDLAPATPSSRLTPYFGVGKRLLFAASGSFSRGLFGTDGTAGGTDPLMSRFETPVRVGNVAFFYSFQELGLFLAVTDGTAFGTAELAPVEVAEEPRELATLRPDGQDPALLFGDAGIGQRLWKLDPFGGEPSLLLDHNPEWVNAPCVFSPCSEPAKLPGYFTAARDGTFFLASEPGTPIQLWFTDGLPAGTRPLHTFATGQVLVGQYLFPQRFDLFPRDFATFRGGVLFTGFEASSGFEPWVSDGTVEGTRPLGDLVPGSAASDPRSFAVMRRPGQEDVAYFFARTGGEDGLWRTDGTPQGTERVTLLQHGGEGATGVRLVAVGERLYFTATSPATGEELWWSDGTAEGTQLLADIFPGSRGSGPQALTAVEVPGGSALVFAADDGVHGHELWVARGGAVQLYQDIAPGPAPSGPADFRVVGARVFFAADDGIRGRELWAVPGAALVAVSAPVLGAPRSLKP